MLLHLKNVTKTLLEFIFGYILEYNILNKGMIITHIFFQLIFFFLTAAGDYWDCTSQVAICQKVS